MAFTAKTRKVGNVTVVDLDGRITLGESTGTLRNTLRSLLDAGDKRLLLNMHGVSYVDSAGLGELVSAYTTATNAGGVLKLVNVQDKLNSLMQVTKLFTIFPIFDNEKTAVESFGSAAAV